MAKQRTAWTGTNNSDTFDGSLSINSLVRSIRRKDGDDNLTGNDRSNVFISESSFFRNGTDHITNFQVYEPNSPIWDMLDLSSAFSILQLPDRHSRHHNNKTIDPYNITNQNLSDYIWVDDGQLYIDKNGAIGGRNDAQIFATLDGINNGDKILVRAGKYIGFITATAEPSGEDTDTTPPSQTITIDSLSADTGQSDTDFITKTKSQTITASLSAELGADEMVYGSLDNGSSWTDITSKVDGREITWDGVQLLDGLNSIKFKLGDAADNFGEVVSKPYIVDTVAPQLSNPPPSLMYFSAVNDLLGVNLLIDEPVVLGETGLAGITALLAGPIGMVIAQFSEPSSLFLDAILSEYTPNISYSIGSGVFEDVAGNEMSPTTLYFLIESFGPMM